MIPTPRLLIVLLLGAVPLAASGMWAPAGVLTGIYAVALAIAVALDVWLGPGRGHVAVQRRCESHLYLGADNPVTVVVHNRSRRAVRLAVRDEYPHDFAASARYLADQVPPGEQMELRYTVRPPKRGLYTFGDIVLRVEGALGLITRQHRCPAAATAKVYPNLLEIRKYELLGRRGLLAEVGLRNARLFGTGTEFEALREYLPDDDYRRIHWKATARRSAPVTVEYETERSQSVVVLIDAGRLMGARVGELSKLDHAINCLAVLAYVAILRGDRVGLLCFSDKVEAYLPPARGRRQLYRLLDVVYGLQPQPVEANLGLALSYLSARSQKRSLLVVFSDLVDPEPAREVARHLGLVSRHHLAAYVSIRDPEVTALAAAEARDTRAAYAAAVAQRLLNERLALLETLSRHSVIALDLPAEQLNAGVINKYLEIKARTRL